MKPQAYFELLFLAPISDRKAGEAFWDWRRINSNSMSCSYHVHKIEKEERFFALEGPIKSDGSTTLIWCMAIECIQKKLATKKVDELLTPGVTRKN